MSSHSGLWRFCRYTVTPNALPNANVVRNFTSIAYQSLSTLNDAKLNASKLEFTGEFCKEEVQFPLTEFNEAARRRMFCHWVRNEADDFQKFKIAFKNLVLSTTEAQNDLQPVPAKPIAIDPLDVPGIQLGKIFGNALQKVMVNSTYYHFVIPETVQAAIFEGWNEKRYVLKLLWPFARELGLPAYVLDDNRVILQLVPPKPPRKGRQANGYDYVPNRKSNKLACVMLSLILTVLLTNFRISSLLIKLKCLNVLN